MSAINERAVEISNGDENPTKQDEDNGVQIDTSERLNTESRLIDYLQALFELESLRNNSYLINRLNRSLELHPTTIYSERTIQNICQDPAIIDSALEKVKEIEYQSGSVIKLKASSFRKTVIVKSISRAYEQEFKAFIEGFLGDQNVECQISYNPKTEAFSLTFADEPSTIKCFSLLLTKQFNQKNIDCILKEENLYLELIEGLQQNKKQQYHYPPYANTQYSYGPDYGFSSQPMPMYFMPYPNQMLGQNYIRKSKESYRGSNNDLSGRPSNSTYESNEQSPTCSPTKNYSRTYGQYNNNRQYPNQRNGEGYRDNRNYYPKRSYRNEPELDEDTNEQLENNEKPFKNQQERQYYGQRDDQYQHYGEKKRREYKDREYKQSRNYKKGLSEAEIEKLTKVDLDNYPPLG